MILGHEPTSTSLKGEYDHRISTERLVCLIQGVSTRAHMTCLIHSSRELALRALGQCCAWRMHANDAGRRRAHESLGGWRDQRPLLPGWGHWPYNKEFRTCRESLSPASACATMCIVCCKHESFICFTTQILWLIHLLFRFAH